SPPWCHGVHHAVEGHERHLLALVAATTEAQEAEALGAPGHHGGEGALADPARTRDQRELCLPTGGSLQAAGEDRELVLASDEDLLARGARGARRRRLPALPQRRADLVDRGPQRR